MMALGDARHRHGGGHVVPQIVEREAGKLQLLDKALERAGHREALAPAEHEAFRVERAREGGLAGVPEERIAFVLFEVAHATGRSLRAHDATGRGISEVTPRHSAIEHVAQSRNCPRPDPAALVPADAQQPHRPRDRALPEQIDGQSLEQRGELRAGLRPGDPELLDPMSGALHPHHHVLPLMSTSTPTTVQGAVNPRSARYNSTSRIAPILLDRSIAGRCLYPRDSRKSRFF